MERTLSIAGFNSKRDLKLIVTDIKRPLVPELTEQVQDIPGMRGVVYQGMNIGQKAFDITFFMECIDDRDCVRQMRDLSNFFVQMMDGKEYPLIFSDEQDVTWWVHPVDITAPEKVTQQSYDSTFTVTFNSSAGTGEGETVYKDLTSTTSLITPKGNTTTYPVFTLVAGESLTKVGVSDGNKYIYLGKGFNVENQDAPRNQMPRILTDPCNTLASWTKVTSTTATFNIENGVISDDADMRTTGKALAISQKNGKDYFGKNVSGKWHGASRMQWLSTACDDWKVTARMYINNKYPRAMGKIELYLLDTNGRRIGKLMVKDNDESLENVVQAQIGYDSNGTHKEVYLSSEDSSVKTKKGSTEKKTIKYKTQVKTTTTKNGKSTTKTETVTKTMNLPQDLSTNTYTDFYGNITLMKKGNQYTASVQLLDSNGNSTGKLRTSTFTDSSNKFGNKLAGIAVYVAKYDISEDKEDVNVEYATNTLQLSDVKVWNILGEENQLVVETGDELIIDCSDNTVYKNGTAFMENLYIGSDFFEMTGGIESAFALSPPPDSKNKWYLAYKPRYN